MLEELTASETVLSEEISLPEQIQRDTPEFIRFAKQELVEQKEIETNPLAGLNSGTYFFEDPFIVIDPYENSPLLGLALFTTEKPVNISIFVPVKYDLTDVEFAFDGYNTQHIIPIYGLYLGTENKVQLTSRTQSGESQSI